ncbi:MAG TPA: hypothetical protein VN718_00485 [Rhizomicrobium sp.]|jgi:hypothetical protein|nr:hypothetical protein [Rhizomicrobium sp.]
MKASRKWWFLLAAILLVFAGGMAANEFAAPLVRGVPVPGDDPFTLRFAVSNRGWLLALHDVDFTCVPDQVKGRSADGKNVRVHGAPFPLNVDVDLGPRDAFQYTCPIQGPHLPAQVDHIEAHVEMAYTRFGRRSEAHSAELIWDSRSKVWIAAS